MINISTPTQEKKALQGKISDIYSYKNLKIAFLVQKQSVKKVFLEISQAGNFIKKETLAQVFSCEFSGSSKNTFSYRTSPAAASVNRNFNP